MSSELDPVTIRLGRSGIYQQLLVKASAEGEDVKASVLDLVFKAARYCFDKSKAIIRHMPEFTLHDEEHIFQVLLIMEKLIPEQTLAFLSAPELLLLILTALFHDIGMAPDERQIRAWKGDFEDTDDAKNIEERERFQRFRRTYPEKLREIERFRDAGKSARAQLVEEFLLSEYIRETHADRARIIIAADWAGKIVYKATDLTTEFAQLCFSHDLDASTLLEMESSILCDDHTFACLPFIGVILRLADLLDFDSKRTPSVLYSHLSVRNPISLAEWKKHRAINSWSISPTQIVFSARCTHPAIEAAIRHFMDLIDNELKNCTHVLNHISDSYIQENVKYYRIQLAPSVDRSKVGAKLDISTGKPVYVYRDTRFTLNKNQVIDILMGTRLYGKPDVALRELLQNSIDACLVMSRLALTYGIQYTPKITVRYSTEEGLDFLEVEDNGIGMNQHIIDNYYARIGSSYYQSREFYDLLSHIGVDFKPISRFGIGILSCFMVSDSIETQTRRLNPEQELDDPVDLIVEGFDSIFYVREGSRKKVGTLTKLQLRGGNPWERMSSDQFVQSVKTSVPKPPFEIEIVTNKATVTYDDQYFEQLSPGSLKERQWVSDENVHEIPIELNSAVHGFSGHAVVGILEQDGMPVDRIDVLSKTISIEGRPFELSLDLNYDTNEIEKHTTSIDVTDDGEIESSTHYSSVVRSRSTFSIHGIELPTNLFPDYANKIGDPKLRWPFPILLILDVTSPTDLDLNSARTEIVLNSKWQKFETDLAYVISKALLSAVSDEYREEIMPILKATTNENFLSGLDLAQRDLSR